MMSEMLIVKVLTKHGSPYLPYLCVIRMVRSVYGCDGEKKLNIEALARRCSVKDGIPKKL